MKAMYIRYGISWFFCFLSYGVLYANQTTWSWCYVHAINIPRTITSKTVFKETEPFTQLIFSWNAQRPLKGYVRFLIQARDASTKEWSSWHKAVEWGAGRQLSYVSKSDGIASYEHVRFEVQQKKKCDAYRICMYPVEGANLEHMHTLTVCCADFSRFVPEHVSSYKTLSSAYVKHVPQRSQRVLTHPERDRLCSPTSCAMLVEFLTKKHVPMYPFAANIYDAALDTYGNWAFNMAHAYTCVPWASFSVRRLNTFKELHAYIVKGLPVAVSVRGMLAGAPQAYMSGHLLVVVGYDASKKKVICHDPAFKRDRLTMHAYDVMHFLRAWERSRRLAYCIERNQK